MLTDVTPTTGQQATPTFEQLARIVTGMYTLINQKSECCGRTIADINDYPVCTGCGAVQ